MAKYRYRIEGSSYGGETVVGECNPAFARYFEGEDQDDLIEAVLESDNWESQEVPEDALENPDEAPHPGIPGEDFYMWENDDMEHINSSYADGGFTVYEVPADGSDNWDYDKEVYDGEGILVYGREGAIFGNEEPDVLDDGEGNVYVPVLLFHSSEKGTFGCWFLETDEPFDRFKLGYSVVETNVCEQIESVYYDKQELDCDYDYNDTRGKSYNCDVGWINLKWRDGEDKFVSEEDMKIYWEDFDDNVEYEKEQAE